MAINWQNKSVFTGDNLPIMRGMNSESVDLIYLDPPFNSKTNYAAPIGSKAAGAEFKDTWTLSDLDITWLDLIETRHPALNRVILAAMTNSDKSYLIYMAVRLLEMKRILKDTGSIYLHCDPTMSHYLKLMMDGIFGRKNFRNEIIWHYSGWNKKLKYKFESRHDVILFFALKGRNKFNGFSQPWENEDEYIKKRKQKVRVDEHGNKYVLSDGGKGKRIRRFLKDAMNYGAPIDNVWNIDKINNSSLERTGYPTQKPLALLERIIKTSSNPGDIVFDPFCGCATTLVAADHLHRKWIGIDISSKAVELVIDRIKQDQGLFREIIARNDIPQRTDIEVLRLYNSLDNKKHLYGQQAGNCNGCYEHFEMRNFEVDHIIARSQGGTDHIENLQLLCGNCNRVKGNRGQEYLIAKLEGRKVAYA